MCTSLLPAASRAPSPVTMHIQWVKVSALYYGKFGSAARGFYRIPPGLRSLAVVGVLSCAAPVPNAFAWAGDASLTAKSGLVALTLSEPAPTATN